MRYVTIKVRIWKSDWCEEGLSLDTADGETLNLHFSFEYNLLPQLDRNKRQRLSLTLSPSWAVKRTYGLHTLHPSFHPSVPSLFPSAVWDTNGPDGWSSYSFISDSIHPSLHPSLRLTDDTGCCSRQISLQRLQNSEKEKSSAALQKSASELTHYFA